LRRVLWVALTIALLAPSLGWAGDITGQVTDEDGAPVFGALVQVVGQGRKTHTDDQGRYRLEGLSRGPATLRFSSEGYDAQTAKIDVPAEGEATADAKLRFSKTYKANEVVVTGQKTVDTSPQTSAHTFTREEIESNAGALEDITKAIQQLPGIVSNTDYSSDMYVRGSEDYENLIVLDHQLLANPYHFGVGLSIIDTDLVKNFTFYAAGFPAQYPFATGSVLDVTYKDGNRDHVDGLAEVSLLSAKAQVTGPATSKASWIVAARRSYYEYAFSLLHWNSLPVPVFSDILVRGMYEPNPYNRFVVIAIRSEDGVKANLQANPTGFDTGTAEYDQVTQVFGLDYTLTPVKWFLARSTASYQTFNFSGNVNSGANNFFGHAVVDGMYVNQEGQFDLGRNLFKFGGVYGRVVLNLNAQFPFSQFVPGAQFASPSKYYTVDFSDNKPKDLYGFYVQHEAEIIPKRLRTNIGVRFDHYTAAESGWVVSPRAAVSTDLTDSTVLKFAWGVYYLPPYNSLISSEKLGNPKIRSEKSTHYVTGIEQGLGSDMMLRIEGYYKEFDDLIFQTVSGSSLSFLNATNFVLNGEIPKIDNRNSGFGKAEGVEVFFQKKLSGWWDGWLAYSLSEVRYNDGLGLYGWYSPTQDQRHTLSLVANFRPLANWVFSTTFRLATGRPDTAVEGWTEMYPRTFLRYWQANNGGINDTRFPLYHRLDVRAEYTWHSTDRFKLTSFAEIYNVYDQRNLWGYYYKDTGGLNVPQRVAIYQLPFLPYVGIKAIFL